jgi:ribonuclease P protein component
VVPKRHARRSVTRNLIKRQMRSVMTEQAASLPQGLWVLRLKAAFDRTLFRSPGSQALRVAAREELGLLLRAAGSAPRHAAAPATAGAGTR